MPSNDRDMARNKEDWDSLTRGASFMQSWSYGVLQESLGRDVYRVKIYSDEELVGGAQIIFYPLAGKTIAYAPYGPFFRTSPDAKALQNLRKNLSDLCEKKQTIFVRLDPETNNSNTFSNSFIPSPFFSYRASFLQPRGEFVMDISKDSETLLADMHKKTRYNIRKSLKQNLRTSFYHGSEVLDIRDDFIKLNRQTTSEHQITTHTDEYFETYFNWLAIDNSNFVAVTRKDDHILAINIFVRHGETVLCPFGASSKKGKKLGAYYNIKWSSILEMKKQEVERFSWGGVAVGLADDHLLGLNQFKTGFGGEMINHGKLFDYVHNWPWYMVYLGRKLQTEWVRKFKALLNR